MKYTFVFQHKNIPSVKEYVFQQTCLEDAQGIVGEDYEFLYYI